jgi:putative drug exporter of the RND superfamily
MNLSPLTNLVLRHKRLVVASWVVLTLAGFFAAGRVGDAMRTDFSIPESESFAANQEIVRTFGSGGTLPPFVAVAEVPSDAGAPELRADLRALERDLADAVPGARVASYGSTGDRALLSDDGGTAFALVHLPPAAGGGPPEASPEQTDAAEAAVARASVAGGEVQLTGQAVLEQGAQEESDGSVLVETLVAGVAALAVLAFVFASALAFVPLLMAVVAIPTSLLAVWGLTQITDVSMIVLFLTSLIGLGIAIDYALIVVTRWREERDRGGSNEEAVRIAASRAGSAVVFSGTTVGIGLLAAIVLPVAFLRSMAYGGLLIPLVSVAAALTLLPVVLATLGPRADRRRLRRTERAERHWERWTRFVVSHRAAAAIAAGGLLAALVVAGSGMLLGSPPSKSLANGGPPAAALGALERSGVGAAPLAPVEVVTAASEADAVAARLAQVEGVRAAVAPATWRRDGRAVVDVLPSVDTNSNEGGDVVEAIRAEAARLPATSVGGQTAQTADFTDDVYGSLPLMLALISLTTFLLLARAFRSIVLPLKAIAMNILSVVATWGVLRLVFQEGFGSELLFGVDAVGSVTQWVPLMVFVFLYGLSMDYEVFILSRMREEYDRTGSTDEGVVRGMARTGRLVTSAALILFFSFVSMGSAGPLDLRMLATGLGAGIILDAVVVRALLVPATVSLFGRWNWWLPEPARRLLWLPRPAAEGAS